MKQHPLGRTGLQVSELCLGTMSFGWRTRPSTAMDLLDRFHAAGGNFIEAAGMCPNLPAQPDWVTFPESCMGDWLKQRSVPRSSMVLATRVVWTPGFEVTKAAITACCEASLRRLGTDYLDLLVCDTGPNQELSELLDWAHEMVRAGKVRHLVLSGAAAQEFGTTLSAPRAADSVRVEAVQANYSLTERGHETELMTHCHRSGLGFLARSSLAGGFLAGPGRPRPLHDTQRARNLREWYGNPRDRAIRDAVAAAAQNLGVSMAQVSLSWVLSNPAVTAAVIAPLSTYQLNDVLGACNVDLPWPQLRRLDLVSSSPGPRANSEERRQTSAGSRLAIA